jgi:signal recognition particle GTPase
MLPSLRSTEHLPWTRKCVFTVLNNTLHLTYTCKVLDATLKEITAALLESDVNVKLVASLRQKVKAKVKDALEGSAGDKSKEASRKTLIQKASKLC